MKYKIADMNVFIENPGQRTEKQGKKYLYNYHGESDFEIKVKEEKVKKSYEKQSIEKNYTEQGYSYEDFWYGVIGNGFAHYILEHNGCVLHSSAVAVDKDAYLFSAHCGTGKSTHTSLWMDYFKDRAKIINDDKPCIREIDGKLYVYGTPWSGKTDLSVNDRFNLKAITFICRSEENWIREATKSEAISLFLTQSYKPSDKKHMDLLLSMIDTILDKVKIFRMGCNISEDAVKLAYETINSYETINNY